MRTSWLRNDKILSFLFILILKIMSLKLLSFSPSVSCQFFDMSYQIVLCYVKGIKIIHCILLDLLLLRIEWVFRVTNLEVLRKGERDIFIIPSVLSWNKF